MIFYVLCFLAGCPRDDPAAAIEKVELKTTRTLADFGQKLTAGAVHRESTIVGGTHRGALLMIQGGEAKFQVLSPAPPTKEHTADSPRPLHHGPISALSLSGDGRRLLSLGGKAAAIWDLPGRRMIRQLRGPQKLTAGALAEDGATAYFATEGGHVLSWSADRSNASAMEGFNCTNWKVTPAQMKLPPERRCKFGIFMEPEGGPPMCSYPVTAVLLHRGTLVRACREGSLGLYDLTRKQRTGFLAGHLSSITALDHDRLLLARRDGKLKIYHIGTKELSGELESRGVPTATASSSRIIAVAKKGTIDLWAAKIQGQPLSIPVESKVIWLGFPVSPLRIVALMEDGRLVAYSLQVVPRS